MTEDNARIEEHRTASTGFNSLNYIFKHKKMVRTSEKSKRDGTAGEEIL